MNDTPAGTARELPEYLHAPLLYAGFWRRFAAYIIDGVIVGVAAVVLYLILAAVLVVPEAVAGRHPVAGRMLVLLVVFELLVITGQWLYFAWCESSHWQATPGKLVLGLRVTDMRGQRIGFGRASGRFFGKILSGVILDVGFMLAGWTARKQALHDMLANCCVVRRDGLDAFERGGQDAGATAASARAGMPGWAIALIVAGACFFLIVPVIAIMAAIAIPAGQSYVVRTQVTEGLVLADAAKVAVDEYVAKTGNVPRDNAAAGLSDPAAIHGRYVASVEVDNGSVIVTYGDGASQAIAGDHLVLKPYGSRDSVQWRCGSPDIKVKYLPAACRD